VSQREHWDDGAETWALYARSADHDRLYWVFHQHDFLDFLPKVGRLTIDIGAGEGRLTAALASRGHTVVAVDASPTLARMAHARSELDAVAVADAALIPLRPGVADLVVAFMCLQDMENLDAVMEEIGRLLSTGGRFAMAIAHPMRSAGGFVGKEPDSDFVVQGSYFDSRPWPWRHSHSGMAFELMGIHRPLELYTRALERNGLVIESMREPLPPDHAVRDRPLRRWQRIPAFLHVRAIKIV
jgi:SAM-dependent methyltransferase